MIKKIMGITTTAILALGVISVSYAKDDVNTNVIKQFDKPVLTQTSVIDKEELNIGNVKSDNMLDIMRQNGFGDIVDDVENGNYKAMDDYMNNLSEEDFQRMLDIMREYNPNMANAMENIGREGMINMHNAMGGAQSCHGSNNSNATKNSNLNVY